MKYWSKLGRLTIVVAILAATAWIRFPALGDDRTYSDEDVVLLPGFGVSRSAAWPASFSHAQVAHEPSFVGVLRAVAENDPYPPVTPLVVYAVRWAKNPILSARAVVFAAGLLLLLSVFAVCYQIGGFLPAAIAMGYVGLSPYLTSAGQEIRWTGLAPLLAFLAGWSLVRMGSEVELRKWAVYGALVFLLVHTHYFCVFGVGAHALLVFIRRRELSRPWLATTAIVAIASLPWYLYAIPRQAAWTANYHKMLLAGKPFDSWYQPLTVWTELTSFAYSWFSAWGIQPSLLRMRYLTPVSLLMAYLVLRALRRHDKPRAEDVAFLAVTSMFVCFLFQLALSWRTGHTLSLSGAYFIPWFPLVGVATVFGAQSFSRKWRLICPLPALAVAGLNCISFGQGAQFAGEYSPGRLPDVAELVTAFPSKETAIAHRTDKYAKLFNIFYTGEAWQIILPIGANEMPVCVRTLFLISTLQDPPMHQLPGWSVFEPFQKIGHTRVDRAQLLAPGSLTRSDR